MFKGIVPMLVLAAIIILFLVLPLAHYWIAIILLLGLIYYALFHNPMSELHQNAFGETKSRPKRKLKKRKA